MKAKSSGTRMKLKHCPWCGKKKYLSVYVKPHNGGHHTSIGCGYCGMVVGIGWCAGGISKEDARKYAIITYNTRFDNPG